MGEKIFAEKGAAGARVVFHVWQSWLPQRLGVSLQDVRVARRGLAEGEDFVRDGNRVLFSDLGVERLVEALGCVGVSSEKNGRGNGFPLESLLLNGPGEVSLVVSKRLVNPRYVEAHFVGGEDKKL